MSPAFYFYRLIKTKNTVALHIGLFANNLPELDTALHYAFWYFLQASSGVTDLLHMSIMHIDWQYIMNQTRHLSSSIIQHRVWNLTFHNSALNTHSAITHQADSADTASKMRTFWPLARVPLSDFGHLAPDTPCGSESEQASTFGSMFRPRIC